jgi:prephenate dehydratase
MNKNIAIQGYEGSFHQEAARRYFGKNVQVITCATFRQLAHTAAANPACNGGLMAIENSIAGSILPNYALLQRPGLAVTGEIYLHIRQNLLVNPGVQLQDIREVHSHHMAIQQCLEFLDPHNWKLVETEDTALSARKLRQHHSKHVAAIGSSLAARLFGLHILAPDIHTLKNNYTRFLVLERPGTAAQAEDADKASVYFHTDHSKGSLARVLTHIAAAGINLSKLQSLPIPGSGFQYGFHADMEFDSTAQLNKVLAGMKKMTDKLRVYGVYKKGKM